MGIARLIPTEFPTLMPSLALVLCLPLALVGCGDADRDRDRAAPGAGVVGEAAVEEGAPTLTVTATGRYAANPNIVAVDFIVRAESDSSVKVVGAGQSRLADLKDALARAGIAREDLLAMDDGLEQAMVGNRPVYRARHVVRATVRDLLALPSVLEAAAAAGVERFGAAHYGLGDPDLLAERARVDAHAQALARAQVLADEAGLAVGPVLSMVEQAAPPWPAVPLPAPSPYELSVTLTITYVLVQR